ncbi:MAG: hypothetical protein ACE15B_25280 [Bryobacteraceae bacterium]
MQSARLVFLIALAAAARGADDPAAFRARLLAAATGHLDQLLGAGLKGKSSAAMTAWAYYLTYELTGDRRYKAAGVELADRVLRQMKATKFGVLYIKPKTRENGREIPGGGPPALGWYTSALGYVFHREGGRENDLRYVAAVVDQYPWNEKGWWAAAIDVKTGESKLDMAKPSPVNKNAALAMSAALLGNYLEDLDAALSARLKHKARRCIYNQIIPAQEADGYWHYGLNGNDPKEKDVLGYHMLTASFLAQLRLLDPSYREPRLDAAMNKAGAFARTCIAPITGRSRGTGCPQRSTPGTPAHFDLAETPKRGFELAVNLFATGNSDEGVRILSEALEHFPSGDRGENGAHAARPVAVILRMLPARP